MFQRVTLGGEAISLYELENEVIRGRFGEPRIHFAINCASHSCPMLPNRAFGAADLEAALERETLRFLGEPRNLRVDAAERILWLSSIFDWFESDFTDWIEREHPEEQATLTRYVLDHAPLPVADRVRGCGGCRVEFIPYDWSLNAVPRE